MEYFAIMDLWVQHVRDFKDAESRLGIENYSSEQLARAILRYIRTTRIRQWILFTQRRGDEFDHMIELLVEKGYELAAIRRFVDNEDLWTITLEFGEQ